MKTLRLPPSTGKDAAPIFPDSRRLTLVGAPGAGKTRFMNELVEGCGSRACCLSAVSARFPELSDGASRPGSIDTLFRQVAATRPYMRTDAVSPLDKLCFMIMADEFDELLAVKASARLKGEDAGCEAAERTTPLDCIASIWEKIFPGNRIVPFEGRLMFATSAGDDIIPVSRLSEGEAAALYYIAAAYYAPRDAVFFIESPSLFLHPSIVSPLWNAVEGLRRDCIFVYDGVDADFVSGRSHNVCVWIKSYDAELHAWDYEVISSGRFSDQLFVDLMGTRKPVLFIEGDALHSIDARLYPLVFSDYTVRPLGSCNKVIETVRTFNDMKAMHHLDSRGIVDRDRRTEEEVNYLRRKNIFVPDVAEIENIFLTEDVIRIMARLRGRSPEGVLAKVKKEVFRMFHAEYTSQALQHVRHRVKREVETKIDARFTCITALETHLSSLVNKLKPRENYDSLVSEFHAMLLNEDYAGVLRVFNHKPMLANCGVDRLLGYPSRDAYIGGVLSALGKSDSVSASLRVAVKQCFGLSDSDAYIRPLPEPVRKKFRKSASLAPAPATVRTRKTCVDWEGKTEEQTRRQNKRRRIKREARRKSRVRRRGGA